MAARHRCELLSTEGDPIRVKKVTWWMVGRVEKTQHLLGVWPPQTSDKKNIKGDGGEVVVEASVK